MDKTTIQDNGITTVNRKPKWITSVSLHLIVLRSNVAVRGYVELKPIDM